MGEPAVEYDFVDAKAQAQALARTVAENLRAGIAMRGQALLAVPGGTTPRLFLQTLATQALDWSRVTLLPTDERQVDADDLRSNQHLLRGTLLRGAAGKARLVSLYEPAKDARRALAQVSDAVDALPLPFDAVVLGMGPDGHCASLFADADRIEEALQPRGAARVLPMLAASAPEPRVTLTLSALLATRALYLLIQGAEKRRVLAAASRHDAPFTNAPIGVLLDHTPVAPHLFWCP